MSKIKLWQVYENTASDQAYVVLAHSPEEAEEAVRAASWHHESYSSDYPPLLVKLITDDLASVQAYDVYDFHGGSWPPRHRGPSLA